MKMGMGPCCNLILEQITCKIWNKDWAENVIGKMENGKRISQISQKTAKVFNIDENSFESKLFFETKNIKKSPNMDQKHNWHTQGCRLGLQIKKRLLIATLL